MHVGVRRTGGGDSVRQLRLIHSARPWRSPRRSPRSARIIQPRSYGLRLLRLIRRRKVEARAVRCVGDRIGSWRQSASQTNPGLRLATQRQRSRPRAATGVVIDICGGSATSGPKADMAACMASLWPWFCIASASAASAKNQEVADSVAPTPHQQLFSIRPPSLGRKIGNQFAPASRDLAKGLSVAVARIRNATGIGRRDSSPSCPDRSSGRAP